MMKCWHCGAEQEAPPSGSKLPFRAVCEKCDAYLHCCRNCKNYKVGMPNDCLVPGTDPIADRESFNFCEEFFLKGEGPTKGKDLRDIASSLFGDDDTPPQKDPKDKLRSLFDDE